VKVTVWGDAGGPRTIAEERARWGAIEVHAGAHSYDELSLELPVAGIVVDAAHDSERPLGELIYAELGEDERLRCVAVLDERLDARVFEEHETFFSPLMEMRGKGIDGTDHYVAREGALLGLALTLATKRVGAQPLRWRSGDVRSSSDRYTWPCTWRASAPLLGRAVDHLGGELRCRSASASRIVDRRPDPDAPPLWGREGDWVPLGQRSTLPNGLRVRPGRILSVR
jgi:hypothetical protein